MAYLLTIATALMGSLLAKKCRIPVGAMTGAIMGVVVLNCLTGKAALPVFAKPCMQIMGGALLGHAISRRDLQKMRSIMKAALVLILTMFLLNMTTGFGIYKLSDMSIITALLAAAPGGVSDMALIAEELGADMQIVSIMQLFRMFSIYLIFPPVLKYVQNRQKECIISDSNEMTKEQEKRAEKGKNCLITLAAAFGGGCLLERLGMPAGFMVGSVAACGALNIWKGRGFIPGNWRFYIQSVTGAIIGCRMTREGLQLLGKLAMPVICMISGMLLFTFLFGMVMARVSELDFQTSLLCLTPGGIQETSLLASDMGCDTSAVVVLHTVRLVSVICIFPMILTILK